MPLVPAAPDQPPRPEPAPRAPAVEALLARADAAISAGNMAQAAAELERGVRIAPRDGALWLRLARVRMQQRQWQQAESTGLKCVSLPESDSRTQKSAWELIGAARAARGDRTGADAARQRAAAIRIP
jgi:tetratricopeptide (TPR) repeat protein